MTWYNRDTKYFLTTITNSSSSLVQPLLIILNRSLRDKIENQHETSHRSMTLKDLKNALRFASTVDFWRMSVIWTFSLIISYFHLFSQKIFPQKPQSYPRCSHLNAAITRPICIITGATSGLGAAAACALSKEGFYVVLVGRSSHLLSKAISEIEKQNKDAHLKAFEVDLSSFKSILNFKNSLQEWLHDSNLHSSIQLLINNAGILATSSRLTDEGHDQMMGTNYIGAFFLTKLLLPLLENSPVSSRIVNITSFTHRSVSSIQQVDKEFVSGKCYSKSKHYPCSHIYAYSKLCLLLFTYELHRQLEQIEKSHHVSVIAVDPGAVDTKIMREIPCYISRIALFVLKYLGLLRSPEVGICSVLDAALAPPETSGVYFFGGKGRTINSSSLSYDTKLSKQLWQISSDLFFESQLAYKTDLSSASSTVDI